MSSAAQPWNVLPADLIELQIGQIDLLLAMYPDDIVLEEGSQALVDSFRNGIYTQDSMSRVPKASLELSLPINGSGLEGETTTRLGIELSVPFSHEGDQSPEEPPSLGFRIQQPVWLSKAETSQFMIEASSHNDVLETIDFIKEKAVEYLQNLTANRSSTISLDTSTELAASPLVRVWFYFPSISTRSKRDDFITYAPAYHLTGFLYAGKPGLLCVEGCSKNIDGYMKFIKTESWGDIPAHHKKVSERYRETLDEATGARAFADMREITDQVGERRGARANRGDMKAVEEWLIEKGVGDAFVKVLM